LAVATYTHHALFYETPDELVDGLVPFVTGGIEADEGVVVIVEASIGEILRQRIGSSNGFEVRDSADVYTFPVRTLAGLVETVRAGTERGRPMRVAGQPIWNGRSPIEIAEWTSLEAACNVVFADSRLQMLCPYDIASVEPSVIAAARRTHSDIRRASLITASSEFSPFDHQAGVRTSGLPRRPATVEQIAIFSTADVVPVLSFVESFAREQAMARSRLTDLSLAVHEMVTDAIEYHLGPAQLRLWTTDEELICEIESHGSLASPFAGYLPPSMSTAREGALWNIGQQCDLVAVRQHGATTTVRLCFSDYLVSSRPGCDGIDTLLGVYALGACDPHEAILVEAHLALCEDCRAEADRLTEVVRLMNDPEGDR
jgi:MEDS: MEthanogen/methylotroph, DcmR Sensory domain/Putative zinc-finger